MMGLLMRHAFTVAAVVSILGSGAAPSSLAPVAQPTPVRRPIRVYVFTNDKGPDGFTLPDAKDKTDSLKDLRPYLTGKKRGIELVQSPLITRENADVVVEVLGREASKEDSDLRTVHLQVTADSHTITVDGKDDDGGWKDAAKDGADQIARWIAANYDRLVRQKSPD